MNTNQNPRRKTYLVILLILVALLLFLGWSQASLNLSFIRPENAPETILLLALSTFIFLTFVIFALILARSLLKLYSERQQAKLGSRFKTKMVAAFLALSLVPVCFLFVFAYGLLNRTIDKWFGIPFEVVQKDAHWIVEQLELQVKQRALYKASRLAANAELARSLKLSEGTAADQLLARHIAELDLVAAFVFDGKGKLVASAGEPLPDARQAAERLVTLPAPDLAAREEMPERLRSGQSTVWLAAQPIGPSGKNLGTVVAVTRLPLNARQIAQEIQREADRYNELGRNQKALKRNALSILVLLTLLILFVATWFALFVSKQVIVPIQALAEGTHEVSGGNLGYQVRVRAADELGILIRSFNEMTRQLQENRRAIEQGALELQLANRALEEHGHTMETILENVSVGVISFDPEGQITQVNSTVHRMLGEGKVSAGRTLADLFSPEEAREIGRLFRRASRQGVVTRQMELEFLTGPTSVAVTVSSIRARHGPVGFVLVLEDLTELIHAQKAAAWQEVAQRVAHEIKNPLTPIQLSAERIQKLVSRADRRQALEELKPLVTESAALIDREVATLKSLVDEFSAFARFPATQPVPAPLNSIVEDAVSIFNGRLNGIEIHLELARDLPLVLADLAQMKRALVNLIDNAAEAVEASPLKQILIRTSLDADRDVVELVVADSGPGLDPDAKERLFLPFFSTKRRGTGLGLAIVSRIVSEHKGLIRVEENRPTGTKFVIELPPERSAVPKAQA
jgi:PAS domain S-box-containing protein